MLFVDTQKTPAVERFLERYTCTLYVYCSYQINIYLGETQIIYELVYLITDR